MPQRNFRTPPGKSGILAVIDGTELHRSETYTGTRYSIVAFVHNACERLNGYQIEQLETMGFRSHGCVFDRLRNYAHSSVGSAGAAGEQKAKPSKACPVIGTTLDQKRIVHVTEICCSKDSPLGHESSVWGGGTYSHHFG